ncbi:ATP-binding protein [Undibacterium pigrum]|uniref:Orc1-like AAA ATPase domain-containing protein n=1 Tax=Undibacterium pigrum TaxID=401470 RepID=A0A318JF74_9BURK|nr:ATP-binding protein [Undibacterium pigrum]PXX46505.1 hypothetical protein DFR42_10174 [Undibacterium pigrum]
MKTYFDTQVEEITKCASDIERRVRIVSCFRMLMQQITYGLLEWITYQKPVPEMYPDQSIVYALRVPADGTLVDGLEAMLVSCERMGWAGIARVLNKSVEHRPASRLCTNFQKTLKGLLRAVVFLRNDGAEGHGLVGGYDPTAEIDALRFILDCLASVTPVIDNVTGKASIDNGSVKVILNLIRSSNGKPALIRKIQILSQDRVRVHCQIDTGGNTRDELKFETLNPFKYVSGNHQPTLSIRENSWEPLCYLPDRITDSFTGRESQIKDLLDWINDVESRACLIYGDGGFGKTTLALEFLNRMLDDDLQVESRPTIIVFYTAKRWQWSLDGLQAVGAGQPHLLELLAFIYTLLFGEYPSPDFYTSELTKATQNLQRKIKEELKLDRQEILIVIDNAETLIENDAERITLGKEIKEISRRIARIILTSRRHEHIEASPIGIDVFDETEAIHFLRDRANKLQIKPLLRAKDEDILNALKKLERRPLVLEAFANSFLDPSITRIDQAATRIGNMLREDLGNFLFADAWSRLNQSVRRLLLLMARVADVHDGQSLKICCDVLGITVQDAQTALEETGGIASLIIFKGDLQLTFSKNFLDYAFEKTELLSDGTRSPSESELNRARTEYSSFIRGSRLYSGDRIAAAFRTPLAKAAHRARYEGKLEESKRLYESASMVDSTNGWLWDRYAYFLFHDIRDNEAALHKAKKAVEFLPNEGEVWLTQGIIEARLGDIRACELSVTKAEKLGVAWQRCSVQRAWAYLKAKPSQLGLADKELVRLKAYSELHVHDLRIKEELRLLEARKSSISLKLNR